MRVRRASKQATVEQAKERAVWKEGRKQKQQPQLKVKTPDVIVVIYTLLSKVVAMSQHWFKN